MSEHPEIPKLKVTRSSSVVLKPVLGVLIFFALTTPALAQTGVYTWRNDIGRTGQNLNEHILTPANVNSASFGKLFSIPVDGHIYAQPLYVPGVSIPGLGQHNVLYVATQHDSVYAFDADSAAGNNANPLWQANLLDPRRGAAPGATTEPSYDASQVDVVPEIGITGTPVIDAATGTLYVVAKSSELGAVVQRLHALDITTGAERAGSPVMIQASVPGTGNGSVDGVLNLDPRWAHNRPGLLLLNGVLYVGFGSHGDNGPWHGWILSYDAATLAQKGVYCPTPNGIGSGFWMSGSGLAADVMDPVNHPFGRMFVATGNGSFNASPPFDNTQNFSDDVLNLDLGNGQPRVVDSFTPFSEEEINWSDEDLGSGGVLVLPDQAGDHPHLLVEVGKQGIIYLVDRDNMGAFTRGEDRIVQRLTGQVRGLWSTPAYWNGNVYFGGANDTLKSFSLVDGFLSWTPSASSAEAIGYPGASPAISADGNANGIVWTVDSAGFGFGGRAILTAHDADNVARTLYSSNENPDRDDPGAAIKFVVPTVVNGKVYVGGNRVVSVFGLLNSSQPTAATPAFDPGPRSFSGSLTVSITDSSPGVSIYYTTDGTVPTQNSSLYSAPVSITSTTTFSAFATSPGYLPSPVASAVFRHASQTPAPVFSATGGVYSSPQQIALTDGAAEATIYYTLDGSVPDRNSAIYRDPILISSNTTISALAIAPGLNDSMITTATYSFSGSTPVIDFSNGFSTSGGNSGEHPRMVLNGSTRLDDIRLQLTDGGYFEAGSGFYANPVDIRSFTTDFSFQISYAGADGFTFAIQGNGPNALGSNGGSLGYGDGDIPGIRNSVALKFDVYSNDGEGDDSIGLFTNGSRPSWPGLDLRSAGIDLRSGDTMQVHLTYDGAVLAMTLTDGVTYASYSTSFMVDIPGVVGSSNAYVGFTGATGGQTASQKIINWIFSKPAAPSNSGSNNPN